MSDTIGSLVDKLFTVDSKMWNNQELLYEIRKMSFDEFCIKYLHNVESLKSLWTYFMKVCDLNLQRNSLIDNIDETLVKEIKSGVRGDAIEDEFIQRKHKTLSLEDVS